ncbi:hypothetical protein [Neosynechococcus sphagnicola]|uniref:hypothetical protein n=1 Tax=Neosynechococcus sphagnicola TaxID=1501145 RepID=UPI00068E07E4|nr:hypothetical protein [Neosynechococcus sphagnicola]
MGNQCAQPIQKLTRCVSLTLGGILVLTGAVLADEGSYYGILRNRPTGITGTWIIGDRSFQADQRTRLDEEDGPLKVGVCAEVKYDDEDRHLEIERQPMSKCHP